LSSLICHDNFFRVCSNNEIWIVRYHDYLPLDLSLL
jgi:hypothetical protein